MGGMNLLVEPIPRRQSSPSGDTLEPSGSNMGGMIPIARRKRLDRLPAGYTRLSALLRVSEKTKKKIEMVVDKKKKKQLKMDLMRIGKRIARHMEYDKKMDSKVEMENLDMSLF